MNSQVNPANPVNPASPANPVSRAKSVKPAEPRNRDSAANPMAAPPRQWRPPGSPRGPRPAHTPRISDGVRHRGPLAQAIESVLVIAAVVAFGLAWAAVLPGPAPPADAEPSVVVSASPERFGVRTVDEGLACESSQQVLDGELGHPDAGADARAPDVRGEDDVLEL